MYNILVVDDEEMIRKLVSKYAVFEGHTVDEAENGMLDCFCVPPYPFELKTEEDFDALANLYNVYRSDLKELMEYEKKHPSDA